MGLVVVLQHNEKKGRRGCITMQSITWPWRSEVNSFPQSDSLQSSRTWRIGKAISVDFVFDRVPKTLQFMQRREEH